MGPALPAKRACVPRHDTPKIWLLQAVPYPTVIAREKRAIQYAAAYRLEHCCLWNTGSPGPASAKRLRRGHEFKGAPEL
jgi:hypothetical protein